MIRRPLRTTRTDTLFPYTTLVRSHVFLVRDVAERAVCGKTGALDVAGIAEKQALRRCGRLCRALDHRVERGGGIEVACAERIGAGDHDRRRIADHDVGVLGGVRPLRGAEERRVGKEWVSTCSYWWSPNHKK